MRDGHLSSTYLGLLPLLNDTKFVNIFYNLNHSNELPLVILYLYYDERRDKRWNIAWARGKSRERSPRDFPRAQAIFHCISRLESSYRHSQLKRNIPPVLSFLVGQYWKSWFSVLVWQLGLYFPVLPSRWSNTGPYRPSRELCCGSTRKYTWSGEQY